MHTSALIFAILAGLIPSAIATPVAPAAANVVAKLGADLTAGNHYGAPVPPWQSGKPGWYYGSHPEQSPGIPSLTPDNCKWLNQYPSAIHCPPTYPPPSHSPPPPPPPHTTTSKPSSTTTSYTTPPQTTPTPTYPPPPPPPPAVGYHQTFYGIDAAVQAYDYLTFGLVDTVDDCKAMCNSVQGCGFVNTYHDVNGKNGSPLLTCALFRLCHGAEDADNKGGQTQYDGSVNYIANSDGWCKN